MSEKKSPIPWIYFLRLFAILTYLEELFGTSQILFTQSTTFYWNFLKYFLFCLKTFHWNLPPIYSSYVSFIIICRWFHSLGFLKTQNKNKKTFFVFIFSSDRFPCQSMHVPCFISQVIFIACPWTNIIL